MDPFYPQAINLATEVPQKLYHGCLIPFSKGDDVQASMLFEGTHFMPRHMGFSCNFLCTHLKKRLVNTINYIDYLVGERDALHPKVGHNKNDTFNKLNSSSKT